MGVIPNPKMAFIFPISCFLALIFPILIKYFPKCVGKGSFPKSQIKSLAFCMKPGTVSMLRIRREKTRVFDRHSVNKAYICGNRMGDMGLG